MTLFDHATKIDLIPHKPGCYLMKDHKGRIIYIGKAKDLKNRVRNYFQASGDSRPFVKRLPKLLSDIETIITANEKEALILENTLIKHHKPRYNIALKDDKNYVSLKVNVKHAWPRVEVVRKQSSKDGSKYYGPYRSSNSVRQTLAVLNKFFMLRTCPDSVLKNRTRPCLQYQIKRCPGPCVFDVDADAYRNHVDEVLMFLEGRADELVGRVTEKMAEAAEDLNYELAAQHRDQIHAIKQMLERQQVVSAKEVDRDAVWFMREGERVVIQVMYVRKGMLEGARSFPMDEQPFEDSEIISSFLNVYYHAESIVPSEILLSLELSEGDQAALEELFTEKRGAKVKITYPQRGAKRALLETAKVNAEQAFKEHFTKEEATQELLQRLQRRLSLRNVPDHMECYDISNFQGSPIVASQVVFMGGEADKSKYRRYKMKEVTSQDDFASMHEVLTRRLRRVVDGTDDPPDLIVIDGGKGQLGQAVAVLEDMGLNEIDVVSLAKSRVDKSGFQDSSVTRSPERVFIPGRKNPIILRQNSDELFLLQRIRDESHRVAITFHKKLRRKAGLRSSLDDIAGVGPVTKRALLRHFGSLKKVKQADLAELSSIKGVTPRVAAAIVEHFEEFSD